MSCPSRWRRIVWQSESPVTSFSGSAIMLALLYLLAGLKEADLTRSRFSLHFLWLAQQCGPAAMAYNCCCFLTAKGDPDESERCQIGFPRLRGNLRDPVAGGFRRFEQR